MPEEKPSFRNWPEDIPRHISDYESIPVYELLKRSAKNYPDRKALIFYERSITFSQLDDQASKFAAALRSLGFRERDTIAIMLPNIPP